MSFSITQFEPLPTLEIHYKLKSDEYSNNIFMAVLPFDCLTKSPPYPSAFVVNTHPQR